MERNFTHNSADRNGPLVTDVDADTGADSNMRADTATLADADTDSITDIERQTGTDRTEPNQTHRTEPTTPDKTKTQQNGRKGENKHQYASADTAINIHLWLGPSRPSTNPFRASPQHHFLSHVSFSNAMVKKFVHVTPRARSPPHLGPAPVTLGRLAVGCWAGGEVGCRAGWGGWPLGGEGGCRGRGGLVLMRYQCVT